MKILQLTLHRRWFLAILSGEKTTEFRAFSPHWQRRIEGRDYDIIRFRNGYAADAPTMDVEYKGWGPGVSPLDGAACYAIRLGSIVARSNLHRLTPAAR